MTILLIACLIIFLGVFSMISGLMILALTSNYDKHKLLTDKLVKYGAIASMFTVFVSLLYFLISEIIKTL